MLCKITFINQSVHYIVAVQNNFEDRNNSMDHENIIIGETRGFWKLYNTLFKIMLYSESWLQSKIQQRLW